MDEQPSQADQTPFPGNVLVAASGFIVTGAGWGLFGYLEGDLEAASSATLFFTMTLLHFVVGGLIFNRQAIAVPLGLILAVVGLVVAALQPQFVLVFTNIVIFALLIFARGNVAAGRRAV
jgi:predicted signal transduction protein with EAL and GGDEF domain